MSGEKRMEGYYKALLRVMNDPERFSGRNGISVTEVGEGYAVGEMPNERATQNPLGGVHGGALTTLADSVAGLAAASSGRACVTLSSNMNYLRGARPGAIRCEARIRKAGRNTSVCDTVITDSEGCEIATGTYTFFMTEPLEGMDIPGDTDKE